jgi:phenylacetate-CoA ligase
MPGALEALRRALHRRQRPARYARLAELLANQRLDRDQVLARQRRDLAAMVAFAVRHTDYYRNRYAGLAGVADGRFALGDLPLLTKDDVTAHLDELLVREADRDRARIGHTGGSTGKPLAFWYDDTKHELMRAGMMRSYMGSGWRPGEKILNFWGARQDTGIGGVFGAALGNRYDNFIAAEETIAAHEYTERQLHDWAEFIGAYRPVLLQGYASILTELARHVVDRRLAMPRTLRGVYSTAEVLDGGQRELLERAFGCKVFNQYGSREIPNIACECRRGRMHVFSDMVHLEALPADGENQLVVTSLTNRLMPMIRYDIGDTGRLLAGDCDCGWPFPLMEMGMCRHNDLIRAPNGKVVHPSYFNRLLYGLTQIRHYQWRQTAPERIVLTVVASPALGAEVADALRARLRREVHDTMEFELRHADEIPRTASGKHRFVIGHGPARPASPDPASLL